MNIHVYLFETYASVTKFLEINSFEIAGSNRLCICTFTILLNASHIVYFWYPQQQNELSGFLMTHMKGGGWYLSVALCVIEPFTCLSNSFLSFFLIFFTLVILIRYLFGANSRYFFPACCLYSA